MSDSENFDLPPSEELARAAEADNAKGRSSSSTSSESEKENNTSTRIKVHSGALTEVKETKEELKYRSKHFKDPDDVITSVKLRCTSCNTSLQSLILDGREVHHHPVLKVLMCKNCLEFYGDGDLSLDEEGMCNYCRWCAQGGTLYCCAKCCNAFCKKCIKRNLNRSILVDIESDDWICFVCNGEPLWDLRAICKNASVVSKKMKRKKKEEMERSLKKLQKKRVKSPVKKNSRKLNKWQKGNSSSSSEDDSEDDPKDKKSKKYKNKRKRGSVSSNSDGGKHDKKKKQNDSDSDVELIDSEKECITLSDSDGNSSKKKVKECKENYKEDELPEHLDPEEAKEANSLLTEHLKDIINTGELIAYRANRLLEKKVSENCLLDRNKVDKAVDSVNLLVKLACESMHHTEEFLTSQYKHLVKKVKKRHRNSKKKSTPLDNAENKKQDVSNASAPVAKDDENDSISGVVVNGIAGDVDSDNETLLVKTKRSDKEFPAEKDEEKTDGSPVNTAEDSEVSIVHENAVGSDNGVVPDEIKTKTSDKEESKCNAKKRKIREQDNDSEISEYMDSAIEHSNNEKQIKKKQKLAEDKESLHHIYGEVVNCEENNSEEQRKKEDEDIDKSADLDESITSLSTVKIRQNGSEVDIFADLSFHNEENIPNGGDNKKCDSNDELLEKTTEEANSSNDAATIELLCSQGSDKDDRITLAKESDGEQCKKSGEDSSDTDEAATANVSEPEDEEGNECDGKEENKNHLSDDCLKAQEELLGYISDDEDDDEKQNEGRRKKGKSKKSKDVDEKKDDEKKDDKKKDDEKKDDKNVKKKKPIGPKSKTRGFTSSSSSSATDMESDSSSNRTTLQRGEGTKKRKFRLKDTEAYKNDKKLRWKLTVDVGRLVEEDFQKYYENYYSDEEDEEAKKTRDDKEIRSLLNLKSLKRGKNKKSEESCEESDVDSEDSLTRKKKKKKKKDKKKEQEQEQRLIDFFSNEDDDNEILPDDASDQSAADNDVAKPTKKKDMIDRENEMTMKLLLESSTDADDELNEEEEENELNEKKKKKKSKGKKDEAEADDKADNAEVNENDKMDDKEDKSDSDKADEEKEKNSDKAKVKEKEDEEMEVDEKKENDEMEVEVEKENDENQKEEKKKDDKVKKKNNDDSDDSDKSDKGNKKNWRKDKILTEKLTDLDTSDEERLWNKKKQRESKLEDSDSDVKTELKKKDSKKKVKRRILGSDDDEDAFEVPSSSSESESKNSSTDSDVFVVKKKKKKKKGKKSDSDAESDSSSDFKTKKPRRRRIKAPASDSSSNEDDDDPSSQKTGTPGKGRKKIHHILADDDVAEATRRAAKEEDERRKRIAEKQKLYNEIYNEVEGVEKIEKLVLDFDPETKKELVSVDANLVSKLKPHQAQGIKFMWDACFESLNHIKKNKGSGCILAHCMGLGKTFQIVTLVHTLLNHEATQVKTILVICPLSTVLNWCSEFNKWLKDDEVNVFELTKYKQNYERQYQLKEWMDCGGVMVLGYEMYRNLTNPQSKRFRKKAIETFQSTLVDPGPDVIVCDEGHVLKNEDSGIAKALRRVKTLRRIVLTGTPLQNNLKEYHCMVQFVKPNLLGTRKEFLNRFVNPITNGQFEDSTPHDVKIMKRRAHVLHKMLEGSVQRFDYSVLTPFLPPKHEYVIFIRLHEVQDKAYRHYLEFLARGTGSGKIRGAQLFTDFNNLLGIWTHPRVLQMNADKEEKNAEKKRLMDSDSEGSLKDFIDDDDDATSESSPETSSQEDSDVQIVGDEEKKEEKPSKPTRNTRSKGPAEEVKDVEVVEKEETERPQWWKQFIQGHEVEDIRFSGKLEILFSILKECEKIGDKVLVFSQSLFSLNLIEYFLAQIDTATQNGESREELGNHTGSWSIGLDYFRLDGSSSSDNRHIWCKSFNREDNHRARLFLISTKAGGLGINLFAANRVIIFDASWNPSHDVQSIFRVYRFGQKKPCYIYRFLAQGTMEEKIYDRQVTKLSLSCRVVDEQQIERHYNMADLQELYQFDPEQKTKRPTPILPKDRLLAELLKEHEQWIVTYHEHDSLLENKEEEELNEDERKAAWEEYENEKKGKVVTNLQPPGPGLNMQALREALKNENPQATNEEIDKKMTMIMAQVYDYLNNPQNAAQAGGVPVPQYTTAQLQALQQYQIQQQQMRAHREKQMRMQQDLSLRTAAKTVAGYNPNSNVSFQQYLQNQNVNMNNPVGNYPNNIYRTTNLDKAGVMRLQSKLVPINPETAGASRVMVKNFGMQDMGPNHLNRQPVMLPQVHSNAPGLQNLIQGLMTDTKDKDSNKKSVVPDDVVETID